MPWAVPPWLLPFQVFAESQGEVTLSDFLRLKGRHVGALHVGE